MIQNRILYILIPLVFTSCKSCKEEMNENLCSQRSEFSENTIRTDGYYYYEYNPPSRNIIFFYKNGVLLYGGALSLDEIPEREIMFANGQYYELAKRDKVDWGVFHSSSGKFTFERWYPSTNQWLPYVSVGEVINDSTIHISLSYRCNASETRVEDETYHFKKFGPKPDSANQFIP
jgi:hypothetical protein